MGFFRHPPTSGQLTRMAIGILIAIVPTTCVLIVRYTTIQFNEVEALFLMGPISVLALIGIVIYFIADPDDQRKYWMTLLLLCFQASALSLLYYFQLEQLRIL